MTKLFGKDSKGNLKVWEVTTNGSEVTVTHGRLGGKMASTTTTSVAKNIGKSNETTPEQQAIIEAEAKVVKQLKKGYYHTKEDALGHIERTPMKAQNYKDHKHRVVYPCYIQPKLNGLRMLVDENLKAQSKAGEDYSIPPHIFFDLVNITSADLLGKGLDGEIYAGLISEGGLSLQQINSAFRKENENTHKLKYYVYDSLEDVDQAARQLHVGRIPYWMDQLDLPFPTNVVFVSWHWVENEEQGDELFEYFVKLGYEGIVYRNLDGLYEYGRRSYDLIKRKPRDTVEAKVISATKDKIGQGVLTGVLESGNMVEFLMRKDADEEINYRIYENALTLLGKYVEIEFEELSDAGVPTKPVGIRIRNVNEKTWEATE